MPRGTRSELEPGLKLNRIIPTLGNFALPSSRAILLLKMFKLLVTIGVLGNPLNIPPNKLTFGFPTYLFAPVALELVGIL